MDSKEKISNLIIMDEKPIVKPTYYQLNKVKLNNYSKKYYDTQKKQVFRKSTGVTIKRNVTVCF
jgi:hypothetical protein